MYIILRFLIIYFIPISAMALSHGAGLGKVATNLMEPVSFFSDFIQTGCLLIGGCFIFASIIKYFEHRRSPLMVPMSTVVFLIIAGIILVLLPFVSYYTEMGLPYSIWRG